MEQTIRFRTLLKNMIAEWKWLLRYIKKYWLILLLYLAIGLLAAVFSLFGSVVSKFLIDSVITGNKDQLIQFATVVIAFVLFQHLFQAVSSWLIALVSSKANNEIRSEIYSHIMIARWKDIRGFHSGDLLNRLESDVSSVSGGAIGFLPSLIVKLVQFFGALAIVLYYDKMMALLALMSAPFLFLSSKILIKTIRKYNRKSRELNGEVLSYTEESVRNVQIIKAFDLTKDYIANFEKILVNYRSVKLSYDKFSILMGLCLSLIGVAVSYSCYGLGVYRLWQGTITYGTMTLFLQLSGTLTASFGALASMVPTAVSIATAAGRVMEVTGFEEEVDADKENALALKVKAVDKGVHLHVNQVSFQYDDADNCILRNIDFTVKPGETIGLIGPSGEGKTTLLKLFLGLMKPTEGEIYLSVDENDQLMISDSTRRFCSYVPQTIDMFSGTIAQNLRIVKPDATDEELLHVLKTVDLYDHVMSLSLQLETAVNENGNNFSQGQLQRLSIARALLRDSEIIIMDEATSALDVETEKTVLSNIMVSNPKKICIITTHRESMLKYCDRIYKITANGELTEC
jgi:ABC-type bacteriocin/lantibiotic exporter with double-glycine peptidase domain